MSTAMDFVSLGKSDVDKTRKVMGYPLSDVRRVILIEKYLPSNAVDTAIEEYLKFMSLIALGNTRLAMCSPQVDKVWHTHILCTRSYIDFCFEVLGGYVHHIPHSQENPVTSECIDSFFSSYTKVFGDVDLLWIPYWPCIHATCVGSLDPQ